MWLIAGLFAFALLERLLSSTAEAADENESSPEQQEDEDSDTQNNNDPDDTKKEKRPLVIKKHSAPSSPLSHLNPFHGMSSKQVQFAFSTYSYRLQPPKFPSVLGKSCY